MIYFQTQFEKHITQKGFSLIEVMLAIGVSAALITAIASSATMMLNQRKLADRATETSLVVDRISQILSKPDQCTAALTSTSLTVGSLPIPLTIDGVTTSSSLGSQASVKSLQMTVDSTHAETLSTMSGTVTRYPAFVQVQTTTTVNGQAMDSRVRTIPMHVMTDSTGKIVSCAAEFGDQAVCLQNGGLWDDTAPVGLKCTPKDHCLYAGSYSTLDPAQGGFNNMLTGIQACPVGFKPQRSGTLSIASKKGKYGVTNTDYPVYTCARCGPPIVGTPLTGPSINETQVGDVNAASDDAYVNETSQRDNLSILKSFYSLP